MNIYVAHLFKGGLTMMGAYLNNTILLNILLIADVVRISIATLFSTLY